VSWLGVTMYLTADAIESVLGAVGGPGLWRRTDGLTAVELSRLVHAMV
jgi:hypothetical protein